MTGCIFCKIASGEIKSEVVYEDKDIMGFRDLHPLAPTHVLIIPKKHYATLSDVPPAESDLFAGIMGAITEVARREGVAGSGYRVVANVNKDAGQEIFHLHFHIIGGRPLRGMG